MTDAASIYTALQTVGSNTSNLFSTGATIAVGATALGLLIWAIVRVKKGR